MSYVLVAYSVVLIAAIGFGWWEWQSMRSLEKQNRRRHET